MTPVVQEKGAIVTSGIERQCTRKMRSHKVKPNGYAILMVLFFVALLVVSVVAVAPNIITERRREKETEMIWRGKQYVRGVRLYYQKTHHFPTQLEDLYKPKVGVRFMRQAYKDPMNAEDGSWRLICVGPNGQLLGSLKDNRNKFFFGSVAPAGGGGVPPAASPNNPFASSFSFNNSSRANASPASSSSDNSSLSNTVLSSPPADNQSGANAIPSAPPPSNSSGSSASVPAPQPSASGTVAASQVPNSPDDQNNPSPPAGTADASPQNGLDPVGSSPLPVQTIIVGVGSKINKASLAKYEGAKNYLQFEFVWNGVSATPGPVVPAP